MQKLAEQEDWRRKYRESLRELERESHRHGAELGTLHMLVTRLCLAAQGQSPRLDAELKRLKSAIAQQAPAGELEPLGQAIADAVHELDGGTSGLAAANRAVAREPGPAAWPEPPTSGTLKVDPASPRDPRIRAAVSRLLAELGREPKLARSTRALDAELTAAASDEGLPQLVEKIGVLVVQRIATIEKSRQELQVLLAQLMGQLDSLTGYIASQTEDATGRNGSSDTLNMQIKSEMQAIGRSVDSGADPAQIRQQLHERLDAIGAHLQNYRAREQERAQKARERTDSMRERMNQMEAEARKLQDRLTEERRQLLLDTLTQVPNRAAWDQRFAEELDRWKRFGQPTCVAVWDVDKFKSINDNYGHRAGDKVLTVTAEALMKSIRTTDFVARYGGEEFAMLLPGTTVEDAVRLADRIREAISQVGFHFKGTPVSVTISCGISPIREGDEAGHVFDRADKALYAAKGGGRNRVVSG